MPNPTDVKGVQRFIGFVNYLSKFLPGLSDKCEPLRKLTQKDVEWWWSDVHDTAVQEIKRLVTAEPVLRYYDPGKELTLQADASEVGLGAALMQDGQPIAYASRALTDAETRYAQIEKELLAVVYGLEKFHIYTYGRRVTVQSDHKPLEIISTKPLHRAPKRLQRMLVRMQTYDTKIIYRPGPEMYLADTLSRAYLKDCDDETAKGMETVNMARHVPISQPLMEELAEAVRQDDTMTKLKEVIRSGWPERQHDVDPVLRPYFHVRDELSLDDNLVYRGERVVIPKSRRKVMMQKVHSSHLGIEGCLRRARECLYWPNMNSEMTDFMQKCETCRSLGRNQQKETLHSHDVPQQPWRKVGADIFQFSDKMYLVTVDYYSGFWEIDYLENTKSSTVIRKMKAQFARYGIPQVLITDNGPQFTAENFKMFSKDWEFEHKTSSPYYPQSNGKAENAVKVAKAIMTKAKASHSDPYLSILAYRNTPTNGMTSSPVQRLMSRRTRTVLPSTVKLLKPEVPKAANELKAAKNRQAFYYNKNAKDLQPLKPGEIVRMKPTTGQQKVWRKAVVVQATSEPRSYKVRTADGAVYRRNRRHLTCTAEPAMSTPAEVDIPEDQPRVPQQAAQWQHRDGRPPVTTRSGRVVHPPKRFAAYVRK